MPITLCTVLKSIDNFQSKNVVNASLINEFHQWMRNDQKSESYQKNNLKALLNFANWLFEQDAEVTFYDVNETLYLATLIPAIFTANTWVTFKRMLLLLFSVKPMAQ